MERMGLNVFGGMVTDASVFVLLKRTNQAWTKRERERNPGIQKRVHSKMSRLLSFAGFGVISLLKLLPYFGNSSGPKSLIIYRQLVHPPPQQYVYFSTFHLRPSILSFKLCPQNQSWLGWVFTIIAKFYLVFIFIFGCSDLITTCIPYLIHTLEILQLTYLASVDCRFFEN